jgi:hypothetical protein
MEWTHLPKCERHSGFRTKLNTCVGCEGYITPGDHFYLEKLGMSWMGPLYHLVEINTTQSA